MEGKSQDARTEERALARRCAAGDAEAIRALEAAYFPRVKSVLARLGLCAGEVDELLQVLRVRLFVADGVPPGIATYDGRAQLSTWLHTVAVRLARRALRGRGCFAGEEEIDSAVTPASPELCYFRAQYRGIVDRAVREALSTLPIRERHILRCWATGMTLDEVASFYGVHRSTASRWTQDSRHELEKRTRAAVMRLTGMSQEEYTQVTDAVLSELVTVVTRALVEQA